MSHRCVKCPLVYVGIKKKLRKVVANTFKFFSFFSRTKSSKQMHTSGCVYLTEKAAHERIHFRWVLPNINKLKCFSEEAQGTQSLLITFRLSDYFKCPMFTQTITLTHSLYQPTFSINQSINVWWRTGPSPRASFKSSAKTEFIIPGFSIITFNFDWADFRMTRHYFSAYITPCIQKILLVVAHQDLLSRELFRTSIHIRSLCNSPISLWCSFPTMTPRKFKPTHNRLIMCILCSLENSVENNYNGAGKDWLKTQCLLPDISDTCSQSATFVLGETSSHRWPSQKKIHWKEKKLKRFFTNYRFTVYGYECKLVVPFIN